MNNDLIDELYDEYVRFLSQKQIADIVAKVRTATLDEELKDHECFISGRSSMARDIKEAVDNTVQVDEAGRCAFCRGITVINHNTINKAIDNLRGNDE